MGQVDFNFYQQHVQENSGNNTERGPGVGFFFLKQDKEQATVKFLIDSPEDLTIMACHKVQIGNSKRWVNCLRDVHDITSTCPLCSKGEKVEYRVFVPMLEYKRAEDNSIVVVSKIWERPAGFANTLVNLLTEYGPLSESVFKITRNGAPGTRGTTYDITYARPEIYKPSIYVKDTTAFNNYSVLGTVVLDYDYNKLTELANTLPTPQGAPTQATPYSGTKAFQQPSSQVRVFNPAGNNIVAAEDGMDTAAAPSHTSTNVTPRPAAVPRVTPTYVTSAADAPEAGSNGISGAFKSRRLY